MEEWLVSDELAGVLGGSDNAIVEVLSLHLTTRNESNSKFWVTANRRNKNFLKIYLFDQQTEYAVFHKLMWWQESILWTF
jgi:hypothetical protein